MDRLARAEDGDIDGLCLWGEYLGSPVPRTILLAEDLRVREIRLTLLHEMAHMKVNIKFGRSLHHGKIFKKELRRLAAAGAMDAWL